MDAISRMMNSMTGTLPAGVTGPAPQPFFERPEVLKNISAFSSGAAGVGGLIEGFATARNLKAIRKQEGKALKRNAAQIMSQARVNYAKAGVLPDEGTPIDVLAQSADQAELDQIWLKYRYRNLQASARLAGVAAGVSGVGGSLTTLLSKKGR